MHYQWPHWQRRESSYSRRVRIDANLAGHHQSLCPRRNAVFSKKLYYWRKMGSLPINTRGHCWNRQQWHRSLSCYLVLSVRNQTRSSPSSWLSGEHESCRLGHRISTVQGIYYHQKRREMSLALVKLEREMTLSSSLSMSSSLSLSLSSSSLG